MTANKTVQRYASDSFGKIAIPDNALWGAQTQRSLKYFSIGRHRFDSRLIKALVAIKSACAQANRDEGVLENELCEAIVTGCDAILQGQHGEQFPLHVWQTGSGTQTNMNVNEVISSLANMYLDERRDEYSDERSGGQWVVHPNDHVNMSQSSNDIFPSAMHLVVAQLTHETLFKSLDQLETELTQKEVEFNEIYTVGRTHLMDALPLTVGAVLSAFRVQLVEAKTAIMDSVKTIYLLAMGGTAVGSGSNAPQAFGQTVCALLERQYGLPFKSHSNLYAAVSGENCVSGLTLNEKKSLRIWRLTYLQ